MHARQLGNLDRPPSTGPCRRHTILGLHCRHQPHRARTRATYESTPRSPRCFPMPWHGHLELPHRHSFVPGARANQLPLDSPIGSRACDLSEESEVLHVVSLPLLAVPGKRPRLAVDCRGRRAPPGRRERRRFCSSSKAPQPATIRECSSSFGPRRGIPRRDLDPSGPPPHRRFTGAGAARGVLRGSQGRRLAADASS